MSIPKLDSGLSTLQGAGLPFETDLIVRLAREVLSGEGGSFGKELVPSDPGLTGGFPLAGASSSTPVHPAAVSSESTGRRPLIAPPAGGHPPEKEGGREDSYEFGEPRCNDAFLGLGTRSVSQEGASYPFSSAEANDFISAYREGGRSDYYFLQDSEAPHYATVGSGGGLSPLEVEKIRRDFPALHQRVNGKPLIWLDNAATTHKPQSVIDATSSFYGRDNSNIHRAAHTLAGRATDLFEAGREKVRRFLGASSSKEIVFVRGASEAINLVAQSFGRTKIGAGDEIVLSALEHHANIVPWQLLAQQVGAKIRVIPMNERGELLVEEFPKLLGSRTKIVAVTHVSNALGTITPIQEIIAIAHGFGIPVLVDGAQSTPHLPINVQALDADFFVFSGHKIFGPTGIGALYGKAELLEAMPPWQGGGHMIRDVTFEKTEFNSAPEKFEAGTPDIAGVVGLGAAVDYLLTTGLPSIAAYEHALLEYAISGLSTVPGVRLIGTAERKASVLGFVIPGVPNEKIAKHLDKQGIAVRAGHHCAQPALRHFGVEGTVRPSLAFYNTFGEVDALINALHQLPTH